MLHFVTEMCTFLLQNGALWDTCLTNALWDLWDKFNKLTPERTNIRSLLKSAIFFQTLILQTNSGRENLEMGIPGTFHKTCTFLLSNRNSSHKYTFWSFLESCWTWVISCRHQSCFTVTSHERQGVSNPVQLYCLFNRRKHRSSSLLDTCDRRTIYWREPRV